MGVSAVLSAAIPAALLLYFRKKKKADILPFFIGCAVFILFALVIEGAVNSLLFSSPAGAAIQSKPLLLALVGGLMAGLFEETGRFAAFRTVLRGRRENDANSLMYGAGHGGIEAMLVLGASMITNIVFATAINSGGASLSALTAGAPEETLKAIGQLADVPSWTFLLGIIERCLAITLHIALSVIVWFGAKEPGKLWLYPLAIALHALTDAAAVFAASAGVPTFAVEGIVALCTLASVLIALAVWKKHSAQKVTE
jgi:uncharacterized membrane protein YhfC